MLRIITTSWDDGSIVDLKVAELLSKYGIKGTFYIPKSLFARPLGKSEIRGLAQSFEIGAHTLNHADLTKIPLSEAKAEIAGSKAYLEDLLGHPISMFCYVSGKYNPEIKRLVKDSGFMAARTIKRGSLALPSDPYEWAVTSYLGRGRPHLAGGTWLRPDISIKGLWDWETRAKLLFEQFLRSGGVYHIWGHSLEYEVNLQWAKLERVLAYIARQANVSYLNNGEIFAAKKGPAS